MFLLALQLQNVAQPAIFKFKQKRDADREFEAILKAISPNTDGNTTVAFLLIEDDFGHKRALYAYQIEHPTLIDMEKDADSQAQMAVFQARAQAQANRAVQADPSLRLATMSQGQILS